MSKRLDLTVFDQSDVERLWSEIQRVAAAATGDECWVWDRGTNGHYGVFALRYAGGNWAESGRVGVHRFALAYSQGGVLEQGVVAMHDCDNKRCVRPAPKHIIPGTSGQNTKDAWARGLITAPPRERSGNGRKTHCPQDHEYTSENTYVRPSTGQRYCMECRRVLDRKRYRRQAPV